MANLGPVERRIDHAEVAADLQLRASALTVSASALLMREMTSV